jgi:hypothetical protein
MSNRRNKSVESYKVKPTTVKNARIPVIEEIVIRRFGGSPLPHIGDSLKAAKEYTTQSGNILSLPQIFELIINNPKNDELNKRWFTPLTEQLVGIDKYGGFTKKGKPVVITIHGWGILDSPEKMEHRHCAQYGDICFVRLAEKDINDVLHGGLPNGKTILMYCYDQFLEESALPTFLHDNANFGVYRSLDLALKTGSGHNKIPNFYNDSQLIVLAGSARMTREILDFYNRDKEYHGQFNITHHLNLKELNLNESYGQFINYIGNHVEINGNCSSYGCFAATKKQL